MMDKTDAPVGGDQPDEQDYDRHSIGGNNPPLDPFETAKAKIDDLVMEAKNWLDGAEVKTADEAEGLATLLNNLRDAAKEADEARVAEKKPLDEQIAEIQARYAPLISDTKTKKGIVVLAIESCKAVLGRWQAHILAEQEAVARAARERADAAALEAQQARSTAVSGDLEATARAQEATENARKADIAAQSAANATPKIKNRGGKAVSLKTVYLPEISDLKLAARHFWQADQQDFESLILTLAARAITKGVRDIPGITIKTERRTV
jgi:hypothetical protein